MLRSALIIAAATLAAAAAAAAQNLPTMKPGLWESSTSSGGPYGAPAQTSKSSMCVNAAVQKDMLTVGQKMGASCRKSTLRQDGNKYLGEAECTFGSSTVKSQSVTTFSGDTGYRVESRATISPPLGGMSQSTSTQEGKYVGPCPANMKPGDMNMGGRIVNINDLAKMTQGMSRK